MAKDSLLLLELLTLLFENWANSQANRDSYLLGLLVSLIEVLMHSAAFWARLKQSSLLQRTLLKIHDSQRDGQILKVKTLAII